MPRLQRAKTCTQAVERGIEYLLSLQAEDGSFGAEAAGVAALHKLPLVLASAGRVEEAQRLLTWLGEHLRDGATGAFQAGVVPSAWLVVGAQATGRYDLSLPSLRGLLGLQGGLLGGVYEPIATGRSRTHHLTTTAAALWAFLACGHVEEARRAGLCLDAGLRNQPRGNTFHARFDHAGQPAGEADPQDPTRPVAGLADTLEKTQEHQQFDILGLPQIALAKLHLATGDGVFLDAAKGYAHIGHRVEQHLWLNVSGWANAWGEATLYRMTRRRRYLRYAERLVGYLIDQQLEGGGWVLTDSFEAADQQPVGVAIDTTATALHCLIECLREVQ